MGSKLSIIASVVLLFVLGCSKDDDGTQSIIPQVVTVVSDNSQETLVIDVITVSDQAIVEDVTDRFVNATGFKVFASHGSAICYIYFEFPVVKLWRRDLNTAEEIEETVYVIPQNEVVLEAITSPTHAYLLIDRFVTDDQVERLVHIFNIQSGEDMTINLGTVNTFLTGSTYLREVNGFVYAYSAFGGGIVDLFKIDNMSGDIEGSIRFEDTPIVVFDEESFFLFSISDTYVRYSQSSLQEIGTGTFEFGWISAPGGFFENAIVNDRLLINFSFAQPSSIASAPMEVSISQNELLTTNLNYPFELKSKFEQSTEESISFEAFAFDATSGLLVVGYRSITSTGTSEGGIIYSNLQGDILDFTSFEVIPTEVVLRQ